MIFFATPCYRSDPNKSVEFNYKIANELKLKNASACTLQDYPNIEVARSLLISEFHKEKFCSYVFLRDDDIDITAEVVYTMLAADVPAIMVPYKLRTLNRFDVVKNTSGECLWGGLGCALIRRDVIDKLWQDYFDELHFYQDGQLKVHLFRQEFAEINGQREYMKEDHAFWYRVRTSGFKIDILENQLITHAGITSKYPSEINVNA